MTTKPSPSPGSPEALRLGCTCPVSDNRNGLGIVIKQRIVYWYNLDCPVHAEEAHERQPERQPERL